MSLLGMLRPALFKRYSLTEALRLRIAMPLEIIDRRTRINHSDMRWHAL